MKKVLLAVLAVGLAFTAIYPAQAEDQKVLAIIDTAIDSSKLPSVIHEVCFAQDKSCLNGQTFMEGKGAGASRVWPASIHNTTYHGHNMAQVALLVDPEVKIIFIRVANITSLGNSGVTINTLSLGMDWVSKNALKYGIDAVSISQSSSSTSTNILNACTGTGVLAKEGILAINAVSDLTALNIPVFAGTGNNSNAPRTIVAVGFPACINKVVGVGAVKSNLLELASYTNRGDGLDLIASGAENILNYRGTSVTITGTSVSTALAAASYVKNKGSNTFIDFSNRLLSVLGFPYITK